MHVTRPLERALGLGWSFCKPQMEIRNPSTIQFKIQSGLKCSKQWQPLGHPLLADMMAVNCHYGLLLIDSALHSFGSKKWIPPLHMKGKLCLEKLLTRGNTNVFSVTAFFMDKKEPFHFARFFV